MALKKRADILLKFYFCRSSKYIEPLYQDYYGTPVAGDAEHEQEGNVEVSIWSHVLNEQSDLSSHSSNRYVACYRPQTKLRKGNVFTSVCQEFYRGGGVGGCVNGWSQVKSLKAPFYS